MKQYIVSLTDEADKALAWDAASPQEWVDNLVHNKTRQCIDAILIMAFQDVTDTIIKASDKNKIQAMLHARGYTILRIESWAQDIKEAAVGLAKIKSAAERLAEWKAENA